MTKERNYGIEILRLLLMFMVCILHTLGRGGVLSACVAGTAEYRVFWLMEILSYCAVDGFAIISGYMATDKPRKYEKLAEMWFQVFFYSFFVTLFFVIIGTYKDLTAKEVIKCLLPMTFGKYWYFTAYFLLFLVTPILNRFLFEIDDARAKKVLAVTVVLFSVLAVMSDSFGTHGGYSALWLIVLYCLGVLAKKVKLFEAQKSLTLIVIWGCCILVTWGVFVFAGNARLVSYISPTILLSGMIMVILFSRIKISGTVVSKLSPLAFGIYLFQLNQVVYNVLLNGRFAFIVNKNILQGIAYVFAFSLLIFISGLAVEWLRSLLAKALKIPCLSKKIVGLIDKLLAVSSALMK